MLRYRAGDALRAKATAVLSSNRLLLLHTNYTRWLAAHGAAAATADRGAFLFRRVQLAHAAGVGSAGALVAEYGAGVLGAHFLAPAHVGLNAWLFFFNVERYTSTAAERWGHSRVPTTALRPLGLGGTSFVLACGGRDRLRAAACLAHVPAAVRVDAPAAHLASGGWGHRAPAAACDARRGQYAAQRGAQFLLHGAPDGFFLFTFASLLQAEDGGVNFSPAVKELALRSSSYSSLVARAHSAAVAAGRSVGVDYAPFVLFDAGCRVTWARVAGLASTNAAGFGAVTCAPHAVPAYPLLQPAQYFAAGEL